MAVVFAISLISGAATAVCDMYGIRSSLLSGVGLLVRSLFYPVLISVLLTLPVRRLTGFRLRVFWYDVVTIAGCGIVLIWYLLLGRALILDGMRSGVLFYPLGDVLLMFTVSGVLLRGVRPEVRLSAAFLISGALAHLAVDCVALLPGVLRRIPLRRPQLPAVPGRRGAVGVPDDCRGGDAVLAGDVGHGTSGEERILRTRALLPYGALVLGYLTLFPGRQQGPLPVVGVGGRGGGDDRWCRGRQIAGLREMNWLATTDSLTSLANRRSLVHRLDEALDQAAAEATRVALLTVDLTGSNRPTTSSGMPPATSC
jgi:hypothetical protein